MKQTSLSQEAVKGLINGLLAIMESNLAAIVLYGSVARGTDSDESDVDIAVILNNALSAEQEDALSDLMVDLNLKYGRVFSIVDIEEKMFEQWKEILPFYKNISKDGNTLWTAA
ncbi:MAG: nucleotidyltransferase domain-containing protein [Ruminococcus sp.]|uniref:nucleotidyltransferase domain-containing protein n=1 Tax=Ruminococcus sp. TaxID=41978 RepID=UPI001B01782D|nr:nucleotidyltransferase domain-containing protein [Ruminococcus sp.]MBO7472913.1 nucleotidyltransferase domain-containing protein [Ruminococcus sp.]